MQSRLKIFDHLKIKLESWSSLYLFFSPMLEVEFSIFICYLSLSILPPLIKSHWYGNIQRLRLWLLVKNFEGFSFMIFFPPKALFGCAHFSKKNSRYTFSLIKNIFISKQHFIKKITSIIIIAFLSHLHAICKNYYIFRYIFKKIKCHINYNYHFSSHIQIHSQNSFFFTKTIFFLLFSLKLNIYLNNKSTRSNNANWLKYFISQFTLKISILAIILYCPNSDLLWASAWSSFNAYGLHLKFHNIIRCTKVSYQIIILPNQIWQDNVFCWLAFYIHDVIKNSTLKNN